MITDHSRVAPSAFAITEPCPGSLQLQEKVAPLPDTEEISEGKAGHHVAAEFLRGRPMAVGTPFVLSNAPDARVWKVDQDMYDGAELWADTMGPGCTIESPLHIPRVHAECWGTPDAWNVELGPDNMPVSVTVGDYKYGHRFVEVFENLQVGAGYASGVLSRLGVSSGDDKLPVHIKIVQPRAFASTGPVSVWTTTPFGLNALVSRVRAAAILALGENPPTTTGAQCKDCKARHICGTLRKSIAHVVDYTGTIEPVQLDTVAAATELAILDEAAARLDARRTGLFAQVEAEARAGRPVLYYGMEPGRSKFDWDDNATVDEVASFGALLGHELRKPRELITPTQAVTRFKIDEGVIKNYATRKPGGMSLKRLKDVAARKVFSKP